MRKFILIILSFMQLFCFSQNFNEYFENKTLRIDYIFSGNKEKQFIAVDQLNELPQWAGRKHSLSETILDGNGQIRMYDLSTDSLIYVNTFSTLFQEWLTTPEAITTTRSFENVYLLPFPKNNVKIEISLRNKNGDYVPLISHIVNPKDILIQKKGFDIITPHTVIHKGNDNNHTINVAILAEGYTKEEMNIFRTQAKEAIDQILTHKPFDKYKNNFNFIIVESKSNESGVSIPRENKWISTAFNSHFDTFYSDRYLTTSKVKDIHNALAGIPYEHIIILANTSTYGGGGIYNAYTLTTSGHKDFKPVVVHEFGHSFAGLADEYFYASDALDETYQLDQEPWEKNITTLVDFKNKWNTLLTPTTPIPTNINDSSKYSIGVFEGGGYRAQGIYRACTDCRMKTNSSSEFCLACQKAIEELILYYCE